MKVQDLGLTGLKLVHFDLNPDPKEPECEYRGVFGVGWSKTKFADAGLVTPDWQQLNVVCNERFTVRAFHAEPWGKYVFVPQGLALGMWVDVRPDSETFSLFVEHELSFGHAVYVPPGIANGYYTEDQDSIYIYLTTQEWFPGKHPCFNWKDPDICHLQSGQPIRWLAGFPYRIKRADREAPLLRDLFPDHPRFAKH